MRMGYMVPEFPGQTHGFFWREIQELERLGLSVDIVSTRRPMRGGSSDGWTRSAISRTRYLHPLSTKQLWTALVQLIRSGVPAWWRCAAKIVRCPPLRCIRMLSLLVLGSQLAAVARERQWSHVHVHSCADAAFIAMFAHLLTGLSYSLTLHGDLRGYGPNQESKWHHAAFAIVVCRAVQKQATELIGSNLPAWVGVAPMGVDFDLFSRRLPYIPYRGNGPLRVFSCARLHPGKGHEDLIQAVALAKQKGLKIRLTIGGDEVNGNHYRERLDAIIEQNHLRADVRLTGSLSAAAIRDELEAAHVFVLASHQEALGVATMEAMAMELPVIVTRTGGVPELVENSREGMLIETRHPDQLAHALMDCARKPATCVIMGQAGRVKVQQKYHSGLSARAIMDGIEHHALMIAAAREVNRNGSRPSQLAGNNR